MTVVSSVGSATRRYYATTLFSNQGWFTAASFYAFFAFPESSTLWQGMSMLDGMVANAGGF